MKRLCLMALSLLMLSFNAFAQVVKPPIVKPPITPTLPNLCLEIISTSGAVEILKSFPQTITRDQTATCLLDITLTAATTYAIKGTLRLTNPQNGNAYILNCSGANIIVDGGTISGPGTISGANIFVCNNGQISNDVTLSGCTMFSETDNGMATTIAPNQWNFIGLYDNENLQAFRNVSPASTVWVLGYDYASGDWDNNYCTDYNSHFDKGEGVFVYPQNQTTVPFTVTPITQDVSLTKTTIANVIESDGPPSGGIGNKAGAKTSYTYLGWFALSNPFVKSIDVASLISGMSLGGEYTDNSQTIQGGCVYTYNGGAWAMRISGSILPGQGFFVYKHFGVGSGNTPQTTVDAYVNLQYSWTNSSSKAASRDFLTVSVATDGYKVPVMFAQNDQATEEYDIFDANKLFGDGSVAEPYLVCNGIELCKEEVNSENYTATMNIKSFESRSVEIVADNIPEGYSLTLIDGAVEVAMNEGDVYTTDITEGENADRFKLLINKNNVSIADVAEVESVRVVNNNRSIAIYGGKNVRTEVYNALGQKVYETSDRTFDLNDVASGAYVLKVQDGKSVSSSKIIVR